MTKQQLRAELFRIKGLIRDALLDEAYSHGTESDLYVAVHSIWKEMNNQDYK